MAEEKTKYISENGLISLLENLSGKISDWGSSIYGNIMGQMTAKIQNELNRTNVPVTCTCSSSGTASQKIFQINSVTYGTTYLVKFLYGNSINNIVAYISGNAYPIRLNNFPYAWASNSIAELYFNGEFTVKNVFIDDSDSYRKVQQTINNGTTDMNSDAYNFSYPILFSDLSNKNGSEVSSHVGSTGIKSNFAYNPSNKKLTGVASMPDVSSIGSGDHLTIHGDVLTLVGDTKVDIYSDFSVNISGETNIDGVITAENGDYIHMPNNTNMCDLDEYKSDHCSLVSSNLSNTAAYTSPALISTIAAGFTKVFETITPTSPTSPEFSFSKEDVIHFYMGNSTSSTGDPKWIINPVSNEVTDLYNRTLTIPGPCVKLKYNSGAPGSSITGGTPNVPTRLASLTCTYKAKIYKGTTYLDTKVLGTTQSISKYTLQSLQIGEEALLTMYDLTIDFSEQEWLELIQKKDSTFTLKNWRDNISIVIVGDLHFARPQVSSSNVEGFDFSIGDSNSSVPYPVFQHNQPKPFYEGSQDGMRHYFNDVNFFSMKPGEYTELYTPEFNITTTGKGVSIGGNCYATAFYETSDEKLKNFSDNISVDFDKLKEIRKLYFTWKDGDTDKMQIGTSAQDVQKVYPELVSENKDGNLTVDYAKLSLVALAAVDKLEDRLSRIEKVLNITE